MNKKIILVEDDLAIIDIYQTAMGKSGFDVETISSGEGMLQKVKEISGGKVERPDIILLDLILPDMNGIELLGAIRKSAVTESIIVFILSNQETLEKQLPEGVKADKILLKANISPTDLVKIIQETIG